MEIGNLQKRSEVKTIGDIVESPIEGILLYWFYKYQLYPEVQYQLPPYRADFAFPEVNLVVECDGRDFHSTEEQKKNDDVRDKVMREKGWTVRRFSGSEIYRQPWEVCKAVIEYYYHREPIKSEEEIMNDMRVAAFKLLKELK